MRTTVTLDDDLMRALQREATKTDRPFKEVLNAAVRAGLGMQRRAVSRARRYRVKPFDCALRPGIDPRRLNQWVDELAISDFAGGKERRA